MQYKEVGATLEMSSYILLQKLYCIEIKRNYEMHLKIDPVYHKIKLVCKPIVVKDNNLLARYCKFSKYIMASLTDSKYHTGLLAHLHTSLLAYLHTCHVDYLDVANLYSVINNDCQRV